jgi:nucleoside-diphosphate-sugar epimerase
MKKVLISGAGGFIARHISKKLKDAGFYVIGTSRTPRPIPNYDEVYQGILGEPLEDIFENHEIDAFIHCAHDKHDIDNKKNAKGTCIWAKQAEKNKVELQIFISSLSADEDAITPYGRMKYEIEKWFISHGHIVLRPGLVIGDGGLFKATVLMVKKMPVLPLFDMGKNLTYITDVHIISTIVRDILIHTEKFQRGKIYFLQQRNPVYIVEMLKKIRKQLETFCIFVPLPAFVLSFLIKFSDITGIRNFLGININNLKGMRIFNNKTFRYDLSELGYPDRSLDTLIHFLSKYSG